MNEEKVRRSGGALTALLIRLPDSRPEPPNRGANYRGLIFNPLPLSSQYILIGGITAIGA
jgi:hypothetical protein